MTAQVGCTNRNKQRLVVKTTQPGNDHNQYVWVLVCERDSLEHAGVCCHQYGANGSDFHQRRCPVCQSPAAAGLRIPSLDRRGDDA